MIVGLFLQSRLYIAIYTAFTIYGHVHRSIAYNHVLHVITERDLSVSSADCWPLKKEAEKSFSESSSATVMLSPIMAVKIYIWLYEFIAGGFILTIVI